MAIDLARAPQTEQELAERAEALGKVVEESVKGSGYRDGVMPLARGYRAVREQLAREQGL